MSTRTLAKNTELMKAVTALSGVHTPSQKITQFVSGKICACERWR